MIEYITILGISVIFIVVMTLIFTGKIADINSDKLQNDMDDLSGAIKIKLDTAKTLNDGYSEKVYLPEKINSREYTIITQQNYLIIQAGDKESIVLIPEINGNFSKGYNTIIKDGGIYIQ